MLFLLCPGSSIHTARSNDENHPVFPPEEGTLVTARARVVMQWIQNPKMRVNQQSHK